jgi:hypothetical protein
VNYVINWGRQVDPHYAVSTALSYWKCLSVCYTHIKFMDIILLFRDCRLRLKCDGTRVETKFHLSTKRMSPFKVAGVSVQSNTGSRGVRISGSNGSNAGYTMFRGSVKSTGYSLHSPVSPSLPLPCVTVCHHISNGLYKMWSREVPLVGLLV